MMKKALLFCMLAVLSILLFNSIEKTPEKQPSLVQAKLEKVTMPRNKKSPEDRALFNELRLQYEIDRQKNPYTGTVTKDEKFQELSSAKNALTTANNFTNRAPEALYIPRGPGNFGGRTRALAVDLSDNTGNTMLAGAISGGMFRTTNGGVSWTKVSPNDEIHNVSSIAQDPRPGNQNIWYYGTGEISGNSASAGGAFFFGRGIWRSTDSGVTWTQIANTDSNQTTFDSVFDFVHSLSVHPSTGDLFAAIGGAIVRINDFTSGGVVTTELSDSPLAGTEVTDVKITTTGRVYAAFSGDATNSGVWTSATGTGGWTNISNTTFTPVGRVVMGIAPSNENKVYILFVNGSNSNCATATQEADLWMWNQATSSFTNFSGRLPSEGCSTADQGNNPLSVQGGYDLVVSVKPNDENFVVIGGTNAYKKNNINTGGRFTRIGGYASNASYAKYANHHPDIHALVFNPFNSDELFSGSDGGVHLTTNINAGTINWTNLNNGYQTFQYYTTAIDPVSNSDFVVGGAQDNGTTVGGTTVGLPDAEEHLDFFGGDGAAVAISADNNPNATIFLSTQQGRVFRFINGSGTVEITPNGSSSAFVTYFYLDPDNNNALYYAGQNRLWRTTNSSAVNAATWTNMGTTAAFGDSDNFTVFATTRGNYNPATSYLLLGGNDRHIYRMDDPQNAGAFNSTSSTDITPAGVPAGSVVTGLAIHPTNRNIVMATYSNYGIQNIYLTNNATANNPSWTVVERNLSDLSIRSAAIAEVDGEDFYMVGTARGLYSSTDPTSTDWVREAPNQIGFALVSNLNYRPADNKLLVGTHGNGMYEGTLVNSTLSIESPNDLSSSISLYPNPTTDILNVDFKEDIETAKYEIFNILGQSSLRGELNAPIDVSALKTGQYFIKITANDTETTKRFIKK